VFVVRAAVVRVVFVEGSGSYMCVKLVNLCRWWLPRRRSNFHHDSYRACPHRCYQELEIGCQVIEDSGHKQVHTLGYYDEYRARIFLKVYRISFDLLNRQKCSSASQSAKFRSFET